MNGPTRSSSFERHAPVRDDGVREVGLREVGVRDDGVRDHGSPRDTRRGRNSVYDELDQFVDSEPSEWVPATARGRHAVPPDAIRRAAPVEEWADDPRDPSAARRPAQPAAYPRGEQPGTAQRAIAAAALSEPSDDDDDAAGAAFSRGAQAGVVSPRQDAFARRLSEQLARPAATRPTAEVQSATPAPQSAAAEVGAGAERGAGGGVLDPADRPGGLSPVAAFQRDGRPAPAAAPDTGPARSALQRQAVRVGPPQTGSGPGLHFFAAGATRPGSAPPAITTSRPAASGGSPYGEARAAARASSLPEGTPDAVPDQPADALDWELDNAIGEIIANGRGRVDALTVTPVAVDPLTVAASDGGNDGASRSLVTLPPAPAEDGQDAGASVYTRGPGDDGADQTGGLWATPAEGDGPDDDEGAAVWRSAGADDPRDVATGGVPAGLAAGELRSREGEGSGIGVRPLATSPAAPRTDAPPSPSRSPQHEAAAATGANGNGKLAKLPVPTLSLGGRRLKPIPSFRYARRDEQDERIPIAPTDLDDPLASVFFPDARNALDEVRPYDMSAAETGGEADDFADENASYDDDGTDELPPSLSRATSSRRRGSRLGRLLGLSAAAGVLALLGFAGVSMLAGSETTLDGLRVIQADARDVKVRAPDAAVDEDAVRPEIPERAALGDSDRLVRADPVLLGGTRAADDADEPRTPRQVRTVIVRPDGSIVPAEPLPQDRIAEARPDLRPAAPGDDASDVPDGAATAGSPSADDDVPYDVAAAAPDDIRSDAEFDGVPQVIDNATGSPDPDGIGGLIDEVLPPSGAAGEASVDPGASVPDAPTPAGSGAGTPSSDPGTLDSEARTGADPAAALVPADGDGDGDAAAIETRLPKSRPPPPGRTSRRASAATAAANDPEPTAYASGGQTLVPGQAGTAVQPAAPSRTPTTRVETQRVRVATTDGNARLSPRETAPARRDNAAARDTVQTAAAGTDESPTAGPWGVQLSSQRSRADAESAFRGLQERFPGILRGVRPTIAAAQVDGRGTFYRVRVGATSQREAGALCERLKSAGADCFVGRN